VDIQPYGTAQVTERDDILNIGGFSDEAFKIVDGFAAQQLNSAHWLGVIEAIAL